MEEGQPTRAIYVMACAGADVVKIGITSSVRQRRMELQIGSPLRLDVAFELSVPWPAAAWLEREVHDRLHHCHSHGEWFSATSEAAINAIMFALADIPGELMAGPRTRRLHPPAQFDHDACANSLLRTGATYDDIMRIPGMGWFSAYRDYRVED